MINHLCSFSNIGAKTRAGPIHKPAEIEERCLLSGKPFGGYILNLLAPRQCFAGIRIAQVGAAGEHCPYLMEPGCCPGVKLMDSSL